MAYDGRKRVEVSSAKIYWNGKKDSWNKPLDLLGLESSDAWAQICGMAGRGSADGLGVVFREADEPGS